jgi:hypothetical protein
VTEHNSQTSRDSYVPKPGEAHLLKLQLENYMSEGTCGESMSAEMSNEGANVHRKMRSGNSNGVNRNEFPSKKTQSVRWDDSLLTCQQTPALQAPGSRRTQALQCGVQEHPELGELRGSRNHQSNPVRDSGGVDDVFLERKALRNRRCDTTAGLPSKRRRLVSSTLAKSTSATVHKVIDAVMGTMLLDFGHLGQD